MTRIRVLVVDDEPLVRAGLVMLLDAEESISVVGQAGDGAEAVDLAVRLRPDVVVMDLRMPGVDGVEATRRLVSDEFADLVGGTVPVLMLTTFHDDTAVHTALRAGASGFVLKSAAPSDLAAAIRAVVAGNAWLDPVVARKLLRDFTAHPELGMPTPAELGQLTRRETEVLTLVAHGMNNAAVAAHFVVSEATVRTHVSRILVKLGLHDRSQAVAAAYQTGLVKPGDRPPLRDRR
ncbi:response regulator transcription factor [Catenuloplanes atrovinosus]|uniref:DNA-binding NarL/FixJ family response regulator n=1 Tax=Catenuloplanes atrovinosus TaxID=137266 RepID=A0AAE4C7Y9_9ACTN|nr:response regulator transcription factor [Catenuloplanes atrovinosus]MDR7274423.1 DNA-binding NarL/FixJ family response regulator [Catenuloplanes atrovinosus]